MDLFVVSEGEQAIVTQFGKPVGDVRLPGLHFKIPFMSRKCMVLKSRISKMGWSSQPDSDQGQALHFFGHYGTLENCRSVCKFFKTVATENGAQSRLDDIIDSVVRDAVSGHLLVEMVQGKRLSGVTGREPMSSKLKANRWIVAVPCWAARRFWMMSILEKAQGKYP